ncbi:MAG TPA: aryl-sulfate sulfotransferase, partial [Ilumatobacteraceae bacterium]|nr:aryl-sulfate sulfotransferase [Ilumatobacteraceae bacterium]
TADSLDIVGDPLNGPARQHDVRVLPNGNISMFDNRTQFTNASPPLAPVTGAARYVEYAIDETAGTATMVREIRNPSGFFSGATGSARLQPDGGVVINWGALPGTIFSEYDADNELLFELHMPGLNSSYRTVKEPVTAFDIAELRQTAGR